MHPKDLVLPLMNPGRTAIFQAVRPEWNSETLQPPSQGGIYPFSGEVSGAVADGSDEAGVQALVYLDEQPCL